MTRRILIFAFSLLLFAALQTPAAWASSSLDPTLLVTIKKGPVELPGTTLQPGKYEFNFSDVYRNVVEVEAANNGPVIGYFIVLPTERQNMGRSRVDLSHPAGSPERIKDFFLTGETTGYAFQYPAAAPVMTAHSGPQPKQP